MMTENVRILVINPINEARYEAVTRAELEAVCPPDPTFDVVSLVDGPATIESREDEQCAVPGVVARVAEWRAGCDAMVINCFADPGLREARQETHLPIVGPGAASFHMAAQLGRRIAIVTVTDSVVDMIRDVALAAGVGDRLASIRTTGLHVAELEGPDAAQRVAEECVATAREDSADVVILGCTGMAALARVANERLREDCPGVPLVVPATAAFLTAYAMARMRLSA